jgi:hypothetical protein
LLIPPFYSQWGLIPRRKFGCKLVCALAAGRLIDKLIGESVQIFDTLVPINDNTFAVTSVDKKKAGLVA